MNADSARWITDSHARKLRALLGVIRGARPTIADPRQPATGALGLDAGLCPQVGHETEEMCPCPQVSNRWLWQSGSIATTKKPRRLGSAGAQSPGQASQRDLVEQARSLPGVAQIMDVYSQLCRYTNLVVDVQPGHVRNATGGNTP